MKELIQQRDLAQSRLEDLLLVVGDEQASREWVLVFLKIPTINSATLYRYVYMYHSILFFAFDRMNLASFQHLMYQMHMMMYFRHLIPLLIH